MGISPSAKHKCRQMAAQCTGTNPTGKDTTDLLRMNYPPEQDPEIAIPAQAIQDWTTL